MSLTAAGAGLVVAGLTGCSKGFLDPTQLHRGNVEEPAPLVVPILDQLEPGTDDVDPEFYGAGEVRAEDLEVRAEEYVIGEGDRISVVVEDLLGQGVPAVQPRIVSDRGEVRLQLLDEPVQASDLTEGELEQAIEQAYRDANLLPDAEVTVTVEQGQQRTFSMVGSLSAPGRYNIYQPDLRLLDALVLGGPVQNGVEWLYIIRDEGRGRRNAQQQPGGGAAPADPLAPQNPQQPGAGPALEPPGTGDEGPVGAVEGQAIEVNQGQQAQQGQDQPFQFNPPTDPTDMRVLRVPVQQLLRGELRYNLVIRPGDTIIAPQPLFGTYYMGGHVGAPGVYQIIPGNRVTLKRAIVAARMLDGVAVPKRTDVIRKVGPNQEIWVRVDLDKIFSGTEPDFYLRPDDIVNVGTDALAPFLAAARNAFRLTYGAGFIYDRNFYDGDDNNNN